MVQIKAHKSHKLVSRGSYSYGIAIHTIFHAFLKNNSDHEIIISYFIQSTKYKYLTYPIKRCQHQFHAATHKLKWNILKIV